MFFVFHILVFAYLTCTEINCYSQGITTEGKSYVRKHDPNFNLRATAHFDGTTQNSNKFNMDLKSNIFNKILSDEMLSVKHNHDHQGITDTSFSKISDKTHLVTPTLEVKQKWPMFEYVNSNKDIPKISLPEKDENLKTLMHVIMKNSDGSPINEKLSKTKFLKPTAIQRNLVNNKVVGMRSIPDLPSQIVYREHTIPGQKLCTCMKTNPSTACNHSCTGSTSSNQKRCTHSTPRGKSHDCSRSSVTNHACTNTPCPLVSTLNPYSFYPAFYLPYTYFGSDISYRVTYPQPNIFDDVKHNRKPKCRKTTPTRYDDDLYYDDEDSREVNNYNDNSAENYVEMKMVSKKLENLHKSKKASTLLIDIDYLDETDKNDEHKTKQRIDNEGNNEGVKYDVNKDKLVKELVNDLKGKRKNVVVKDCFCNSSLSTFRKNIYVHLLMLFYYCINL